MSYYFHIFTLNKKTDKMLSSLLKNTNLNYCMYFRKLERARTELLSCIISYYHSNHLAEALLSKMCRMEWHLFGFYIKLVLEYSYLKTFGQLQYVAILAKSAQVCYFFLVLFYFFSPWKQQKGFYCTCRCDRPLWSIIHMSF